jgi:hypothetical protein
MDDKRPKMPTTAKVQKWFMIFSKASNIGELYYGKLLHCFAGILLLLFAISHFIMLTVSRPSQYSTNTVFPFLTNWSLYLVAGVLELATATVCLIRRGKNLANLAILAFLVIIIWYRWALSYTGGQRCDCLGVLGMAFHLNKSQETILPIIALSLLILTLLPWLFQMLGKITSCKLKRSDVKPIAAFALLVLLKYDSHGDTVEIKGNYEVYHYNTKTGSVFSNTTVYAAFKCRFSGPEWSISATNLSASGEGLMRTPWEEVIYDGTNLYTLTPNYTDPEGHSFPVRATVSYGSIFVRDYDEWLDFEAIWMAYGLHPSDAPTNENGIVEIPLPWYNARLKLLAYGAEWKITASEDGRFMKECQVVANTRLDLSTEEELLRPTVNTPNNLNMRNYYTEKLRLRREAWPHGFLQANYKCSDWYQTNGVLWPMSSEETRYESRFRNEHPLAKAFVRASSISVSTNSEHLLPPRVAKKTIVADYRYRIKDDQRICLFAEYVIPGGERWKPANDLDFIRRAKSSSQFVSFLDYRTDRRKSHFTWLLLVIMLLPVMLAIVVKLHKTTNKKMKTKAALCLLVLGFIVSVSLDVRSTGISHNNCNTDCTGACTETTTWGTGENTRTTTSTANCSLVAGGCICW